MKKKEYLAVGVGNLAIQQILLGENALADMNLARALQFSREAKDESNEAMEHQELGRLLAYRGAFDEAELELKIAQDVFDRYDATQTNCVSVVRAYRALRSLLMGNAPAALEVAQQSRTLADVHRTERDIICAEWLLGAALVMEGKDMNTAATHLTEALTRCRRINLVEFEPDILLAWARWHRARGEAKDAQTDAEEALAIADRCEYRLKQADIHNFLARWWMDRAESSKQEAVGKEQSSVAEALVEAKKHAEIAKERAWCDGPPHCYKPALDEAEKMLATQ